MAEGGILAQGAVAIGGALIFLKLCADDLARRQESVNGLEEELSSEANRRCLADSDGAISGNAVGSEFPNALGPHR